MIVKIICYYLQFKDFLLEDYEYVFECMGILKCKFKNYEIYYLLYDCMFVMIFEKSLMCMCLLFEVGIFQFGGYVVFMSMCDMQFGCGEFVEDFVQVIL